MSQEALVKFFQTIEGDEALKERFTVIDDAAEVAKLAESEMGLSFTAEELSAAVASMAVDSTQQSSGELGDEELEAVAGGFCVPYLGIGRIFRLPRIPRGW